MDKGIFYLLCSIVLLASVAGATIYTNRNINTKCVGVTKTMTKTIVLTPTPTAELIGSPSAAKKPTFK